MTAPSTTQIPTRVQRKRTKGFRLPPNTICVSRPSLFGNPYRADVFGRETCLRLYRRSLYGGRMGWIFSGIKLTRAQLALAKKLHREFWQRFMEAGRGAPFYRTREFIGKSLACYCPPGEACHVDVLIEVCCKTWLPGVRSM